MAMSLHYSVQLNHLKILQVNEITELENLKIEVCTIKLTELNPLILSKEELGSLSFLFNQSF
jgi:hypothetical protein